ncbi:MAG: alpha/beta family hydrolase [Thermoanaerobaculia bacterium]
MLENPFPFLSDGDAAAPTTLILAHGAGGPMDSPFLNEVAAQVASAAVRVLRFEFPFMRARRETGRGGAPDREPALRAAWLGAIEAVRVMKASRTERTGAGRLVIGGKSLGGRIASLIADEASVDGLICLGYPFHPPAQPAKLRTAHLAALKTRTLIVQGTRDPFGTPAEVETYFLSPVIAIRWLESGDHSWKPLARSGRTLPQNMKEGIQIIRGFLRSE